MVLGEDLRPLTNDHLFEGRELESEQCDSLFLRARKTMTEQEFKEFCFDRYKAGKSEDFVFADGYKAQELRAVRGLSEAIEPRLVKAPKSPTVDELMDVAHSKSKFISSSLLAEHCEVSPERAVITEWDQPRVTTPLNTPGTKTVVQFRDWADEWRVRTEVEATSGTLPPPQSGDRLSSTLSYRGALKIAEACEYMHAANDGFKTFVTGTFSNEKREKIVSGETTIQKEVSRTMEALQKMYQRGWTKKNGDRVEGYEGGLPYVWVVEIPKNEDGEDNPHIHMLLGWRVDHVHFREWAERIENIWGNGYFHLEKIKDGACAGAYMAKAAGYLTKAADQEDQGVVRGNRYGISETARAPEWVTVSKSQLHAMGQLIFDIQDHLTVKYGAQYSERKRLNKKLSDLPKSEKKARAKVGKRLAAVRAEIKEIPIRCNGYQVVIKGKGNALEFFSWAQNESVEGRYTPEWLPLKPEGVVWNPGSNVVAKDSQYFTKLRAKMADMKFWRRLTVPKYIEYCDEELKSFRTFYDDFFNAELVEDYGLDLCQ